MARKPISHLPTIHDHFDGSAHCVECKGDCRLPPAEFWLSHIVRYAFEHSAMHGEGIPYFLVDIFHDLRIDFDKFHRRSNIEAK